MGIFTIIIINLLIREISVYGNNNLSKEYILSFFPLKKEVDSFNPEYYKNKLLESGNFDYVLIDKKGEDTIDVFVILKEKNKFYFSFLSDITPNGKYTFGIEAIDRFFFKKEQRVELKFCFLNMKDFKIFWYSFKKRFSPLLFFNYLNYKHPENFIFKEYVFLIGPFYKEKDFNLSLLSGISFIKTSNSFEKTLRIYTQLKFSKNKSKNSISSLFDFYSSKREFISTSLESKINFKFFLFDFVPSFKIFLQDKVPPYRKIYLGGYKYMKSFNFGEFVGENAQIYEIYLYYEILPKRKNSFGLNMFLFGEVGNTFCDFNDLKNKRLHKGTGIGFDLSSCEKGLEFFFSFNEKREIRIGLVPKSN